MRRVVAGVPSVRAREAAHVPEVGEVDESPPTRARYPFAAIVGQNALTDALSWLAVEPLIGGVLVSGTRGTAKSTAVRALAALLPPLDAIAGDACNRAPRAGEPGIRVPTPFVELPIGATEDRVIGTLDVRALLAGERRFEPGLLARANRGVLYVDEVNLLPDHLVDAVLDAAATGTNVVERDGASYEHDARIMLVGTMNPEEGELRPQLLDRFGLSVAVENDDDLERRVEIVERRIAFEADPVAFARVYEQADAELRLRIVAARERLPRVLVDRTTLRHAAHSALAAHVEGMRADLTIVRAARAIAAFDGRLRVRAEDVDRAAVAALAHRRREGPHPAAPPPAGGPRPAPASPPSPPEPPRAPPRYPLPPGAGRGGAAPPLDEPGPGETAPPDPTAEDRDVPTAPPERVEIGPPPRIALDLGREVLRRDATHGARGRGAVDAFRGASRVLERPTARIAPLATLRARAHDGADVTAARHLRYFARRGRARALILFAVDASGSMAAAARMRAAKGAVCALLADAYHRRDAVALVAFRGESAELLVPPTRSAVFAYRRLRMLETGGRTPLAAGLRCARETMLAYARRSPGARAYLVLVSDARANAPARGAFDAALAEAARLRAGSVDALCIDVETGGFALGLMPQLADALGASRKRLAECTERTLGATVREWMAQAS